MYCSSVRSSPTSNICIIATVEMLDFKVAVFALLAYLHASSCMAAGLRVPRGESSGVISALLRSPKNSRSVARSLHTRQSFCPAGSHACSDGTFSLISLYIAVVTFFTGKGCCDNGYDCVVVAGRSGCCPSGSTCGGTPVCKNPADKMCPGGQFCCRKSGPQI